MRGLPSGPVCRGRVCLLLQLQRGALRQPSWVQHPAVRRVLQRGLLLPGRVHERDRCRTMQSRHVLWSRCRGLYQLYRGLLRELCGDD